MWQKQLFVSHDFFSLRDVELNNGAVTIDPHVQLEEMIVRLFPLSNKETFRFHVKFDLLQRRKRVFSSPYKFQRGKLTKICWNFITKIFFPHLSLNFHRNFVEKDFQIDSKMFEFEKRFFHWLIVAAFFFKIFSIVWSICRSSRVKFRASIVRLFGFARFKSRTWVKTNEQIKSTTIKTKTAGKSRFHDNDGEWNVSCS